MNEFTAVSLTCTYFIDFADFVIYAVGKDISSSKKSFY